jgi:hypothetical protein
MSNTNAIGLQLGSDGKKDAEGTAGSELQIHRKTAGQDNT